MLFEQLIIVFFGILGAILGSFLNVCIDRLLAYSNNTSDRIMPQGWKALMIPARSFCFTCGTSLSWYENLPILSYVFLRGKCRHCLTPYGIRSLLTEVSCLLLLTLFGISLTQTNALF